MREIKFRAWDPKGDNPQGKGLKGVMMCWEYLRQNNKLWEYEDKGCYIMQYTGLKDVNDVEIYEGDIIEFYGNYTVDKRCGYKKGVITWNLDGMRFDLYVEGLGNYDVLTETDEWHYKRLVVGNIHENKN